jgi:hypothetical protein
MSWAPASVNSSLRASLLPPSGARSKTSSTIALVGSLLVASIASRSVAAQEIGAAASASAAPITTITTITATATTATTAPAPPPQPTSSTATVTGSIALPPDTHEETPPKAPPAQEYVGLEGLLGVSSRLGDPADGGVLSSRSGFAAHAGVHYAYGGWKRKGSLGLVFDSAALGTSDRTGRTVQIASDSRRLQMVGLEGRVFPVRWETGRLFLGMFVGAAWETSRQIAAVDGTSGTGSAVRTTRCSGRGDPSFALGLTGGLDFELGSNVSLLARGELAAARLPDQPIDASETCVLPTGGSPNIVSALLGISVRFDLLGTEPKSAAATPLRLAF